MLEERPLIMCIVPSPQAFPSATLILLILKFLLAMLPVLILILPEEVFRCWLWVAHLPNLLLSDMLIFIPLGAISWNGLILLRGMVPYGPRHVNVK